MNFESAILLYTISDGALREAFVRKLEDAYRERLRHLDQSSFAIPLQCVRPAEDVLALARMCRAIERELNQEFMADDTIYLCCSAHRLNLSPDDGRRDQIAIFNVLAELLQLRTRRSLFSN